MIQLSVEDGLNNSDISDISGPLLLSAEDIFTDPLCLSEYLLAGLYQKITKEREHAISAFAVFTSLVRNSGEVLSQVCPKKFLLTRCHHLCVAEIDSNDGAGLSLSLALLRHIHS